MFTYDTDMTSDILIYNVLDNSTDEFIQKCNLKFIDKSVPAEEDDTIYVAHIDCEQRMESFDDTQYTALVNIYVKTKNTDYLEGSRFLRTVVKHIKHVLKHDKDCSERNIRFRNIKYEYGSSYTLKGLHLLVQLVEREDFTDLNDDQCVHDLDVEDIELIEGLKDYDEKKDKN